MPEVSHKRTGESSILLPKIAREVGRQNPSDAIRFIDAAIGVVRNSAILPETELIKALGEKAIALWLVDDLKAAYSALEEAAERLLATEIRDNESKEVFMIFGHVSGYLTHLVRTGEEIRHTADDYDYTPPERGMFLKTYPMVSNTFREELVRYLPAQMAIFAKAIAKEEDIAKWSLRAVDAAMAKGDQTSVSQAAHLALESLVIESRMPEALDVALNLGISVAAIEIDQKAGRNPLRRDFDVLKILGSKPSEGWSKAEDYAAVAGILPFFFQLATDRLNGDEDLSAPVKMLTTICQQIAVTASNPGLWTDAADLIQGFFDGRFSGHDLMKKAEVLSSPHTTSLEALSLLAASIESSPEQAVYNHLETMPLLVNVFRGLDLIYEKRLVPFYKAFWSKTLAENSFRFRMPIIVKQTLDQVSGTKEWTVVPRILISMSSGLGIAPSKRVQLWLEKIVQD